MKKLAFIFLGVFFLLLLGIPEVSFAYDSSPSRVVIIPEAIWAPATGGGTWRTELQVYTRVGSGSDATIKVYFMNNITGGWSGDVITLARPATHRMSRWTNILATLKSLDTSGYDHYGKVGALWIACSSTADRISVQARNVHTSNYGKTINGLDPYSEGNYGIRDPWRALMIQGIYQGNVYRSTVVLFNPNYQTITVRVALINHNDTWLGWQDITLPGYGFTAFDPFNRFGITALTHWNCRIWVNPQSGSGKIMAVGATANNYTNDPSSHIAIQYD